VVSVVTVVFNGHAHVADTIGSVLAQEGIALEYWVIDGASTDGTQDIIRANEARLTGWISEPDAGIADAFNKGLERARGDYIMFLNADDALAHPKALADLVAAAVAAGHGGSLPEVVYGDCMLCERSSGGPLYRIAVRYDKARFSKGAVLPHPSMLMHRRYFESHGRFDTSFRVAMDYEMFLRGIPSCGALHIPRVTTNIRAGGLSARSRATVVAETIRALRMHGHLSALGALRMRAMYGARNLARVTLQAAGLYGMFEAARRRRAGNTL
jgi:glycosyltransferase involved in cell wall biosynthesis